MSIQLEKPFKLFTPEQIQDIVKRTKELQLRQARVMGPDPDRKIRNNNVFWLELTQEESDRMWDLALPWRDSLKLTWMQKPVQVSVYGPGEHYTWHRDDKPEDFRTSVRALTLTCTLQPAPSAFFETTNGCYDLEAGEAVFMLANTLHRACAPTSGERWSFTVWYMRPNPALDLVG